MFTFNIPRAALRLNQLQRDSKNNVANMNFLFFGGHTVLKM